MQLISKASFRFSQSNLRRLGSSNEQLCKVALVCLMELAVRMGACSDSGTSGEESSDDDGNPGPGQPDQLTIDSRISH